MEVHNIVQEAVTKTIPKKEMQGGKVVVWGRAGQGVPLQIGEKRREAKGMGERVRYTQLNAEFLRIAR